MTGSLLMLLIDAVLILPILVLRFDWFNIVTDWFSINVTDWFSINVTDSSPQI